jgi:hypothetical protein
VPDTTTEWWWGGAGIGPPLAACGLVVAGLLPWTVSGQAERNAFATVRSARALALAGEGAGNTVLGLWFFVPAVVAAGVLAIVLRRPRVGGPLLAVAGAATVGLSVAVLVAPLGHGVGAFVGGVLGGLTLVAGLVVASSQE